MFSLQVHAPLVYHQPCHFCPPTSTFYACFQCLNTHETRFCDGTTAPAWCLCDEHQRAVGEEKVEVDYEMLDWLREEVWKGRIKRPEPKRVYNGRQSNRAPRQYHIVDQANSKNGRSQTRNVYQDQYQYPTGYARTQKDNHSENATAFISGYDETVESDRQVNEEPALNATNVMHNDTIKHNIWPRVTVLYSHTNGCLHSDLPAYKIVQDGKVTESGIDNEHLHIRGARKTEGEEIGIGQAVEMTNKILSIDETDIPSVPDGVYFKRCNGQFINSTHLVLPDNIEDITAAKSIGQRKFMSSQSPDQNSATIDATLLQPQHKEHTNAKPESSTTTASSHEPSDPSLSTAELSARTTKPPPSKPDSAVSFVEAPVYTSSQTPKPIMCETPKVSYRFLRARSHLVYIGSVSPEDLIVTCWLLNNQNIIDQE